MQSKHSLNPVKNCPPYWVHSTELGEKLPDGYYKGNFNVKLGPMTFNFVGKFGFIELNQENFQAKISATGTDAKGRGGAQGIIDVVLTGNSNHTDVQIISDISLSGSVAQYGRGVGMIQAISQQLINEFGKNLSLMIDADSTTISRADNSVNLKNELLTNKPSNPQNPIYLTKLVWQVFVDYFIKLLKR
jgi:carbon monoxide dehydrogenase subunit G